MPKRWFFCTLRFYRYNDEKIIQILSKSYLFQVVSQAEFTPYQSFGAQSGLLIYDMNYKRIFWFKPLCESLHYSCHLLVLPYQIGFVSASQPGLNVPQKFRTLKNFGRFYFRTLFLSEIKIVRKFSQVM